MRREAALLQRRGYTQYQDTWGEGVLWYEFDAEASRFDNVFDSGGNVWKTGIGMPVMWVIENEDDEDNPPEGGRYTPTLRFTVNVAVARKNGMSDVLDAERHLNDLVIYHRQIWKVSSYNIRGRLAGRSLLISVEAQRVNPDEDFPNDTLPGDFAIERGHEEIPDDPDTPEDEHIPAVPAAPGAINPPVRADDPDYVDYPNHEAPAAHPRP